LRNEELRVEKKARVSDPVVALVVGWVRLYSARSVASRVDACSATWWAGPIRVSFISFLLSFSIIFEIFGEIKNAQIRKFHF
jgi:hypothetical protein